MEKYIQYYNSLHYMWTNFTFENYFMHMYMALEDLFIIINCVRSLTLHVIIIVLADNMAVSFIYASGRSGMRSRR